MFAQPGKQIEPYAVTAKTVTLAEPAVLKLDPDAINILVPNLGQLSAELQPVVRNFMILWCEAKKDGPCHVQWTVAAPAEGQYEVTVSVDGVGSRLVVSCNDQQQEATVTEKGWHRMVLGNLSLKAGENIVRLDVNAAAVKAGKRTKRFLLSALELAQPVVKAAIAKEAAAIRQQPDWFKDAGYGLMFQWTNRATPPEGPIKPWEEKVDDFDLDQFIQLVDDSGAAYVIWSATWGNQYLSAPVKSLDEIISGRTTRRDLLGEMADRLHQKGVKLIFYYHYGYECYHSQDTAWLEAAGGYKADKTQLYANVMKIVSELGARYADKLDGWWFDGGARYLNCHFDGSSGAEGILTAPLKDITAAARTGNPNRVVAYNSWIKPQITDYQDYYGGEGQTGFNPDELTEGVFKEGRQQGLQAHGCFILEKRWGHIETDTPIAKPKFSLQQLTQFVTRARQGRYPLSINLEMYEDGSVSAESAALLKELKATVQRPNVRAQNVRVQLPGETATAAAGADAPTDDGQNAFPGVKTDFHGYDRYDGVKTSSGQLSVICPKQAAAGKPWLWRSLFWERLPKVYQADLKLVDQGYHVVLAFGDVHGHPKGNGAIDAAYELLTTEYGFSKQCSMASISRGTLSLFTWASVNPEKVSSIYVDNGVCNVDSWPGGKVVPGSGSDANGAPKSWQGMKEVYGFTTDQELLDAKVSPIDKLESLAKAGVPILMVCGSNDSTVPYEENDALLEERYKKLGGSIEVIVEDKGHTHGMDDPTPILEFIQKHTPQQVPAK
ncbi:alpha-L-fucosidase [Stieleria sp. TO1_6]|nr:alpha-L-fucosidase [Stieleria tagensis]